MMTLEALRKQTIKDLVSYYKMYQDEWITEERWIGRRDMATDIFGQDEESRKAFISDLKKAIQEAVIK